MGGRCERKPTHTSSEALPFRKKNGVARDPSDNLVSIAARRLITGERVRLSFPALELQPSSLMKTEDIAKRLVALCREQKWEAAQKELYADNAVSIEPHETP